jgi:creatinine amidohydrolase
MMLDGRATSAAVGAAHVEMAVFGIGAIEQHGRHLPVATDWIQVKEISRRVAVELGAFLLPAIPFSMSECHGPMGGTVWLKPATLSAVLRDVAGSLRRQGIRKLLVLNGHGGNFILEPTIQALNQEYPTLRVVMPAEVWAPVEGTEPIFEAPVAGIHAEEVETSMQLYLNPQYVTAERIDYAPPVGREFLDYAFMNLISPDGVWGYASYGQARKGEAAIAAQVRAVVAFARQAFQVLDDADLH